MVGERWPGCRGWRHGCCGHDATGRHQDAHDDTGEGLASRLPPLAAVHMHPHLAVLQTGTAVAHRYTGWSHALRTIVREEGAGAFLAGLRPRVAWISVGGAVFIGSFEEMKRWALRAKN